MHVTTAGQGGWITQHVRGCQLGRGDNIEEQSEQLLDFEVCSTAAVSAAGSAVAVAMRLGVTCWARPGGDRPVVWRGAHVLDSMCCSRSLRHMQTPCASCAALKVAVAPAASAPSVGGP